MFGESDPEPFGGRNKELAQGTLMFHVEQLREMIKEVKGLIIPEQIQTQSRLEPLQLVWTFF